MSARVVRGLAVGSFLLATGVAVGWWGRASGSPERSEKASLRSATAEDARRPAEAVNRITVQAVDTSGIQESVRKAVAEELARAREEAAVEAEAKAVESDPTPEVLAKLDSGHEYITTAIRTGRWETSDATHLRSLGADLSGDQYQELIRPLVIAINKGEISPNVEGMPF